MTNLRTALQWLLEHELNDEAEVWVLSKPVLEPVAALESIGTEAWVGTLPVWSEAATNTPLQWGTFFARLASWYSAGGTFRWAQNPEMTYRGSYTVNPQVAVFLLFLDPAVQFVQSHSELMDERKDQAHKLTKEIETAWQRST